VTFDIIDPNGTRIGRLRAHICAHYDELDAVLPFSRLSCGFSHFASQLAIHDIYPVAVFDDLDISPSHQRKGFGRDAARAFGALAQSRGARLGLLRVGTQGDDYCKGLLWRRRFYASEGWQSFRRPPIPGLVHHWMYHLLQGTTPPSRDWHSMLIEIDELTEFFRAWHPQTPTA
jgi:hypothetical protein